jgi:hypothetical protein
VRVVGREFGRVAVRIVVRVVVSVVGGDRRPRSVIPGEAQVKQKPRPANERSGA